MLDGLVMGFWILCVIWAGIVVGIWVIDRLVD